MTGLRLYTSNRLEILAQQLAEVLGRPLSSPFAPEIVLVQSGGMERWVSLQLARYLGISANNWFPFPNHFIQQIFSKILPDTRGSDLFEPAVMTWKIMKVLPLCINRPGFEEPRKYLSGKSSALKQLQLAYRIADTFDQYLLYRPDMIFRWEQGQENHWQAGLWRELVRENGGSHRAALGRELLDALKGDSCFIRDSTGLPERFSVFGISALPRFYMELLAGISSHLEVNLFLMNPCREYWGDIVSDRVLKERGDRAESCEDESVDLYLEAGNSLLASMGRLGRDFFDLVNEFPCEEIPFFYDPGTKDLLSSIQSHILNLTESPGDNGDRAFLSPDDTSVQIHSCHSPMREMEVLYDWLLDYFQNNPERDPSDVVVMAPDIDAYAPYIKAVFDLPLDDPKRIPFSIADRSVRQESELVQAFFTLLNIRESRFESSRVLDILEYPCIRNGFGISAADVDLVRNWIRETGIRWGIDEETRVRMGLPGFSENSWKAGLERLLLGYAMPGHEKAMFEDILPYDHIEGDDAAVLGRFVEFANLLFDKSRSLEEETALGKWSEILIEILDRFFSTDEDSERDFQLLRRILRELTGLENAADFHEPVSLDLVRWYLKRAVEGKGRGFGFIAGGVTFCAMLPMRSIPFRLVCLIGMNGDSYPRQQTPLGFDLMAKDPRRGDRSKRNDDRYLFLESILSARERLYISYVGQSIRDNSVLPPSVLVSELMDYIENTFTNESNGALEQVVNTHRLQPFSPDYFRAKGRLYSYSETNCLAARKMLEKRRSHVPFISSGLAPPREEEWKNIDIDDLRRFFSNPAKYLLTRRLGLFLDETGDALEEKEPFEIRGLDKYSIEQFMLEKTLEGRATKDLFPLVRAWGSIPPGTVGQCTFRELSTGVEAFARKLEAYIKGEPMDPLDLDLNLGRFMLKGRMGGIYHEGLIRYRYAKIKAKDRLWIWIQHLVLNCLARDDYPRKSMLFGLDPSNKKEPVWMGLSFEPLENAQELLEMILEKYWEGLIKPLHFFPDSSWRYIEERKGKGKSSEVALNEAGRSWLGNDYVRGEMEDEYFQLCFKDTDPIDEAFKESASKILGPLFDNLRPL